MSRFIYLSACFIYISWSFLFWIGHATVFADPVHYASANSNRTTFPCDANTPCNLKFLLENEYQNVPEEQVVSLLLRKVDGDFIFRFSEEEWMKIHHSIHVQVEHEADADVIQIDNLSLQSATKEGYALDLANICLSGTVSIQEIGKLVLKHVQPSKENSLYLKVSNVEHVILENVTRDPVTRQDFLKIELTDIENSIQVSGMHVENKEFEVPLTISATTDTKKLSNIQILDSIFKNNQNGALQFTQSLRASQLSIVHCEFASNQGAGANAMLSISDGALIDKIRIEKSKILGNTGYFNGGGIAIDYSTVAEPVAANEPTILTVDIVDTIMSENAAGPQQKGGSLYIISPSASTFEQYLTISGSNIQASTATDGSGGGVYAEVSTLNLGNNSVIQLNSAAQGAGIHLGKGVLKCDDTVWVKNNVADKFAAGVLFANNIQVESSQFTKDRFNFNLVKSGGSQQQLNPNIGILEPSRMKILTPIPLSLQLFYPFDDSNIKPNVVGYLVDTFGNAITLKSQVDEDAIREMYNNIQVLQSDPARLQFLEEPSLSITPEGFEIHFQPIGIIGSRTNFSISSDKIKMLYPTHIESCTEGHIPTTVGTMGKNPSQFKLKYCAFGDKPIIDNEEDIPRNLSFWVRASAVSILVILAFMILLSLFIVGIFIRKSSQPPSTLSESRIEDYTRFGIDDDSLCDD